VKYEDSCILAWLEDFLTHENFFKSVIAENWTMFSNKMFADGDDSLFL